MKLALALLVFADLLLRGAAVPHAHAPDAADHDHSVRPHLHVTWDVNDHEHSHDHSAPAHDHTAIYLDGGAMMFSSPDQAAVAHSEGAWVTPAVECPCIIPADVSGKATAARPPGDRAATTHDLLPHVLRI